MRLYQTDRYHINAKLMEYTFSAQKKVMNEREFALADECFSSIYTEKEILHMESLPKGWLPIHYSFYVNAGGYHLDLHFRGEKRAPSNFRAGWGEQYNLTDPDLITRLQKFAQDKEKLKESEKLFRRKIESFLRSITTRKGLLVQMPELKDILGASYFEEKKIPCTALTTTAKEIVCEMANFRGEDKEGCCDGRPTTT